jgi:hypothetical protein
MDTMEDFFSFPQSIRDYDGFSALSEYERREFAILMRFFSDLGQDLRSGARREGASGFLDFIDNLELDLAVRIGGPAHSGSEFSAWLIHGSWRIDAGRDISSLLDHAIITMMNNAEPSAQESVEDLEAWFRKVGNALLNAAVGISSAKTFSSAIAHLIAVDSLILKIFLCCCKCRINRHVYA